MGILLVLFFPLGVWLSRNGAKATSTGIHESRMDTLECQRRRNADHRRNKLRKFPKKLDCGS